MPIRVTIDNSTTVRAVYQKDWNWEEFYKANNKVYSILGQSTHPLNLVIDLSITTALPDNMLYHLSKAEYLNHSNLGTIIVIGATLFQEAVYRMLIKVVPDLITPIRFAKTRGSVAYLDRAMTSD